MGARARIGRDERGISSVIVAVSLVSVFGALMLSADAGNLWQARRALVSATDAAALGEARASALGTAPPTSCSSGWTSLLAPNAGPDVAPLGCAKTRTPTGTGYVTVESEKPAAVRFGGLLGNTDKRVYSMSAAEWGFITRATGLRPVGICVQNPHVRSWLGLGPDTGVHPSPGVHRIYYTKEQPDACGGNAPGNWGFLDFNGGQNSNSDLTRWLLNGYDHQVGIRDCNADGTPDGCQADTGSSGGSITSALNTLVGSAQPFGIVIFDSVTGNGANVKYEVYAFLGVILRGFRVNGSESQRYLDFEFTKITLKGDCCLPAGIDTGVRDFRLCSVDHDPVGVGVRCA